MRTALVALTLGSLLTTGGQAAEPLLKVAAKTVVYEARGEVNIFLQMDRFSSSDTSVTVQSVDGTATAPDDYAATTEKFTWAAGTNDRRTLTIPLAHDSIKEGVETLALKFTRANGLRVPPVNPVIVVINSAPPKGPVTPVKPPPVVIPPPVTPPPPVVVGPPSPPVGDFKLFNSTLYAGSPDSLGERTAVVYEQHFFKSPARADGTPSDQGIADAVANARGQADSSLKTTGKLTAMDIERWLVWPWTTGGAHKTSIEKYASSLSRFGNALGTDVCAYAIAPQAGIVHSNLALRNDTIRQTWTTHSNVTRDIMVPHADALCPSIYVYYRDTGTGDQIQEWRNYAIETIKEARRIAPGKPVYPFIWPQFHTGGGVGGWPFVPADYWRTVLETMMEHADGVVIWGGYDFKNGGQIQWDESAEWWTVTKNVLGIK